MLLFADGLSVSVHSFLQEWFSDKGSIEIQTSGSTGIPKLISIQKEFMINSALATGSFFDLPEKTTALLCLSTDYIAGKMMLVRALVLGWELEVIEPISHPLKVIDKNYDFTAMVPLQLHNSIENLHKVKKLIIGGGVVSKELQEKLQHIETQVFATYGMTETVTHIAVKKLNNFVSSSAVERSYYKVLPNISISQDKRNCLVIDAPKIASEEIITNDVVENISKNQFKWLGRFDNVINSGGIKLHPEQIEEKLSTIISQRFFVAGIPDVHLGEKLVLVVESENLNVENLKSSIQNELKSLKSLTKYEIPKEIFVVEEFIETATGKIQRLKTLSKIRS